ncbi:hypothetical protein KGQ20_25395 [Catenulispora sp. NF23]|uniref:hypothetical protein n=1 Tax=Catenulispora pinistramenti TaxID=2705254 RepID=UPI001BAE0A15|nr:hypothetical protein [Catenulispora pinistramenti]MBS2536102.1 hypothetical protein [Catenulispora pinistramenti]
MNARWGRVLSAVAAIAAAAVVTAGCTSTAAPDAISQSTSAARPTGTAGPETPTSTAAPAQPAGRSASDPAPRSTASRASTASTAALAPPTTVVRTVAAPAPSTSPAAPPTPACTAADLALNGTNEVRSQDGKVGDWDTQFILRDASASSCRLDGWPGLAFFGEDTIILCPPPGVAGSSCSTPDHTTPQPISVTRAPGDPREIILAPGGLTLFAVLWTLAANADFCESGMVFSGPYGVHILIPGDPEPLTHLFGSTDRIVPCGQQVQVTAFGAAG